MGLTKHKKLGKRQGCKDLTEMKVNKIILKKILHLLYLSAQQSYS
jgi:hypothetical protein